LRESLEFIVGRLALQTPSFIAAAIKIKIRRC